MAFDRGVRNMRKATRASKAGPDDTEQGFTPVVEWWPIDKVRPFERNAKAHPEEQVQAIAESVKRFGPDVPLVVRKDGSVVKGHGRLLAFKRLGWTKVPVIVNPLDARTARASRIADNKVAESSWLNDVLRMEFQELKDLGVDLTTTGFSESEYNAIMEGWSAAPHKGDPEGDDPGLMARVTITCRQQDRERVVTSIEGALGAAGISDTKVS